MVIVIFLYKWTFRLESSAWLQGCWKDSTARLRRSAPQISSRPFIAGWEYPSNGGDCKGIHPTKYLKNSCFPKYIVIGLGVLVVFHWDVSQPLARSCLHLQKIYSAPWNFANWKRTHIFQTIIFDIPVLLSRCVCLLFVLLELFQLYMNQRVLLGVAFVMLLIPAKDRFEPLRVACAHGHQLAVTRFCCWRSGWSAWSRLLEGIKPGEKSCVKPGEEILCCLGWNATTRLCRDDYNRGCSKDF